MEKLESKLEESAEQGQEEIKAVISHLYHKAWAWQNKKALAQHGMIAHERLEELRYFNNSRGSWQQLDVVTDRQHGLFKKGTNSSKQTSLRLLIKVDSLLYMLRKGALVEAGVEFNIGRAEEMSKEVYFIKDGRYIPILFSHITQQTTGFFKCLELSEEFETKIIRYSLMNIPGPRDSPDKKVFLQKIADVVMDEKRRQFLLRLTGPTDLPWTVTTAFNMPVVIWFRKP